MRVIPSFEALSADFSTALLESRKTAGGKNLINLYISSWEFDEDWYSRSNPDLSGAIYTEAFPSGWHHFVLVGYFEGRSPLNLSVDNEWYMEHYGDVAAAIVDGVFPTALDHYCMLGRAEGRLPCDPGIRPEWYARRYMPHVEPATVDLRSCAEHFLQHGYLNGAIPAPLL